MDRLENADTFPPFELPTHHGDEKLRVPDDLDGDAALVVFYRGHF